MISGYVAGLSSRYPFTFTGHNDTFLLVKATSWEFKNRALVFGLIFAFTFPLYSLDHQNSTAAFANWLAPRLRMDVDLLVRFLFGIADFVLAITALIRSWASAYLHSCVGLSAEVK